MTNVVDDKIRVYVAAASSEIERAKRAMQMLRDKGIEVVSTWPEVIEKVGEANPMGAPRADRRRWAMDDLNELMQATVLWFLLPPPSLNTTGAYVELGFFLAMKTIADSARDQMAQIGIVSPTLLPVCSGTERSIFTALMAHEETDEAVVDKLVTKAFTKVSPE